ncbi:helix-turn-helix transcriptional regulator [Caldinitratiruptor microaerophilus]|uniref:HTH cro/C1-type domain-containing protein n=1 Tax=Caldinitratiruptor microaerophilus TaxID=671077 RepID=A0AA35CPQ1_9FIRM|nr:helix-turn-helix transcriptional regulator [Caldinitratiruptor microaerophilus]BDG61887.1 hypothetical protein caldi_29770 [Caldinitratiruptor microaerophilus]
MRKAMRDARLRLGLSQEDLAQMVGTTPEAIGLYESGERLPPPREAAILALTLRVPVYELFREYAPLFTATVGLRASQEADPGER